MENKSVSEEDNFYYYEVWNYKLSIANFIKNTCFDSISKFFKDNNLAIKNIDDYNEKEIYKIFTLLKNITNSIEVDIALPFDNISIYLENSNISEELKKIFYLEFDNLFAELIKSNTRSNKNK